MARDFSQAGRVVTGPEADTRPGAGELPGRPRTDFHLMRHPENWEIREKADGEYEWLPRLKHLYLQPGVNGIRAIRGGGIDDSSARVSHQDRGWTLIPRELGYVTKYPCRGGQTSAYLTWDVPHLLGRRIVTRHDAEGYADFRRGLVEDGTIPPPEPEALEAVLHRLQASIERAGQTIHIPGVQARVEAAKKRKAGARTAAKKATTRKRAPRKKAQPSV